MKRYEFIVNGQTVGETFADNMEEARLAAPPPSFKPGAQADQCSVQIVEKEEVPDSSNYVG
jgi:hypothetical protein